MVGQTHAKSDGIGKGLEPHYEPSRAEAAALAASQERRRSRAAFPKVTVKIEREADDKVVAKLSVDHEDLATGYGLLAAAVAVDDLRTFDGLLIALGEAHELRGGIDTVGLNHSLTHATSHAATPL